MCSRRLALLATLCLAGCRLGYDPIGQSDGDAGDDAGSEQTPPFGELCRFDTLTVIEDGDPEDDATGASLAASIVSVCGNDATVRVVGQGDPGILDPETDGPLLGPDELAVVGGASFVQDVMRYLLASYTPIELLLDGGRYVLRERATGDVIVDVAEPDANATHDFATVQTTLDPVSGTAVLSSFGNVANGTRAGAFWFANTLGATFASDPNRWYVIEWTNADGDPAPSAGDTFVVLASGASGG